MKPLDVYKRQEYVPVDHASMELAFDDSDRKAMQERLAVLKEEDEKMLYICLLYTSRCV